ncbi:MAG TPA: TonB-dependent receptor, partial [Solimonas sp.]|nr:TonB-dependent receptor [Solimonas sp.]
IGSLTNSANLPALEKGEIRSLSVSFSGALPMLGRSTRFAAIGGVAESRMVQRDLDADFSPVPFVHDVLREPSRFRQQSLELRLSGQAPRLLGLGYGFNFVGGVYYYDATFRTSDLFEVEDLGAAFAYLTAAQTGDDDPVPGAGAFGRIGGLLGGPLGQALDLLNPLTGPFIGERQSAEVALSQRARDYAVFGQFEHLFTPSWGLIGGLRLGQERKIGDMSSLANGELVPLIADQENHRSHRDREEEDISPRLGIKWRAAEHVNTYLTWARGFKSGGFNALPLTSRNLEFDPERATSLELGAKARLLSGTMRVSAAVFSTDFENLQVSTFQNNSFVILNAAKARSRGFEAELDWLPPLPGTALRASVGLADARYLHYPDAPAPATQSQEPLLPFGCGDQTQGLPACEQNVTQDLGGKPLAFAPRWTASIVPSFALPVTAGIGAAIALDVLYRDARFLNVDDDPAKRQPATTQLNLRVTFAHASRLWGITLAAHNLTDELILDQVIDQPLAPGNITAIRTDRGRYLSGNLSLAF